MAVIGNIRKHSGWIVAAIGVAILGFVVQDGLGNRQNRVSYLAEVGGEKVLYEAFDAEVESISSQYLASNGKISTTAEELNQIRNVAYDRLVSNILLAKTSNKIGICVPLEEMNDMYYGEFISPLLRSYFTNPSTGQYDRNQVMNIISNFDQLSDQDKQTLSRIEAVVKEERLKEKYNKLIAGAMYIPTAYADFLVHNNEDKAQVEYIHMPYSSIKDEDIVFSDEDYSKYYKENKYNLKNRVDSRDIQFVSWEVRPSSKDMIDIEENVNNIYKEFLVEENIPDFVMTVSSTRFDSIYKTKSEVTESYLEGFLFDSLVGSFFEPSRQGDNFSMAKLMDRQMRPDSLKSEHILFTFGQNNQDGRSKERSKELADSVANLLKADISRFSELAVAFSNDPSVAQNSGDLGWMKDGSLIPAFNNAIIKGNIGDVVVVETVYGFHVLHITGKTEPVAKVLYCVINIPIEASTNTSKEIFTQASRFLAQCKGDANFDSVCAQNGKSARLASEVSVLGDRLINISNAREIVRWAFNKETKVGDIAQEVFEIDNHYIVAHLKATHKKGYKTIDEIKNVPWIDYRLNREVKADMLSKDMEKAINKGGDLKAIASELKLEIENTESSPISFASYSFANKGYEPMAIGAAFGLGAGKVSDIVRGNSGIYLLQGKAIEAAEASEAQIESLKNRLSSDFSQSIESGINNAMKEVYGVVDNRALFF